MSKRKWQLLAVVLVAAFFALSGVIQAQVSLTFRARDPGVLDLGAEGERVATSGERDLATTVKGRGVSFTEGRFEWHARVATADEVAAARLELGLTDEAGS